ncbi:ATP-binding protein [Streptomyces genisteinicus]|uniref:ATP-binding protein n=1 Tax=Streptomyces genisteinicus TaxID=2768068 RepID=A0A7H0HLS1_9ACTN|nr:ATP-binding protein [Streptomyces genisteinicus]QNP61487.1 ATP-binding protein [Streptomyces genisteinicus]
MTITAAAPDTNRHSVTLPCGLRSPAAARRITARWLAESDCGTRADDAVVIVSELVTNAVRHTRGPCVLTLGVRAGVLSIDVADDSEVIPELHRRAAGGERGGFGLDIVRRLGGAVTVVPRLGGKTVHVALALGDPALGHPGGGAPERS